MGHLYSAKETQLQPLYRLLRAEKRTDVFTVEKETNKKENQINTVKQNVHHLKARNVASAACAANYKIAVVSFFLLLLT